MHGKGHGKSLNFKNFKEYKPCFMTSMWSVPFYNTVSSINFLIPFCVHNFSGYRSYIFTTILVFRIPAISLGIQQHWDVKGRGR